MKSCQKATAAMLYTGTSANKPLKDCLNTIAKLHENNNIIKKNDPNRRKLSRVTEMKKLEKIT